MQFVLTRRGRRASGRGELDPKAASLLILGLLSISRLMSDFSRLLPRPQPCEPLSLLCASSGGSGSPAARAALRPGPPGAWDLQPQRPPEQVFGLCRVSLRFLLPPLCSPALGPEAGVVADKFPGNVVEWGRQKAVTHTESTEQMSLVGHLCRSRWATLFSPPSRRRPLLQTAGPVPWRFRPLPVRSL